MSHLFLTVDGVMQAPGQPDEDREGGFEHGGWQAAFVDEATGRSVVERYQGLEALLLGRKTYEIFAGYWPHASADNPFTTPLNEAPKYVASTTLTEVAWQGSQLLGADVPTEVVALKERHQRIDVVGSGVLLHTLLAADLVDRMNLWVFPVLLGTGKRAFADGSAPAALRLAGSETFATGAVLLTYEKVGRPTYGTMG